jgi:Fe-S-cluster containining protein
MSSRTINDPVRDPGPGMLFATRVLMQNIERQRDPERTAMGAAHAIRAEVIVFMRQGRENDPSFVAASMHRRIDRHMRERDAGDREGTSGVSCSRGCSACCFQNVTTSEPEAKLAYEAALGAGHALDIERLRKQAEHDADTYQQALAHSERRCVMLKDDGDCAIYAARPAACRTYRVVTPPDLCDTVANPGARILSLTTPHAEVVISAAMQSFRYGSFAALLLEAIERGEQ